METSRKNCMLVRFHAAHSGDKIRGKAVRDTTAGGFTYSLDRQISAPM